MLTNNLLQKPFTRPFRGGMTKRVVINHMPCTHVDYAFDMKKISVQLVKDTCLLFLYT